MSCPEQRHPYLAVLIPIFFCNGQSSYLWIKIDKSDDLTLVVVYLQLPMAKMNTGP